MSKLVYLYIVAFTVISVGFSQKLTQNEITISGFSSGGIFAQQLLVAFPNLIKGIAVFSTNYYRCGPPNGNITDFDRQCTALFNSTPDELYNPDLVHEDIKQYESQTLIGNTTLLKNKRLYSYTGLRNHVFPPDMSLAILKVFERYIQNAKTIRTRVQNSQLVMPTNKNGPLCLNDVGLKDLYIGDCGFSGAYEGLNFLLQKRVRVEPKPNQNIRLGPVQEFDQDQFTRNIENHQMDSKGYFYFPKECQQNKKCPVHFFVHGCRTGRQFNGTMFIERSGYLEVAELNKIIMIFPQAISTPSRNEGGCWDTFGLSGPLYATNMGAQMSAVKLMMDKVIAEDFDFLIQ